LGWLSLECFTFEEFLKTFYLICHQNPCVKFILCFTWFWWLLLWLWNFYWLWLLENAYSPFPLGVIWGHCTFFNWYQSEIHSVSTNFLSEFLWPLLSVEKSQSFGAIMFVGRYAWEHSLINHWVNEFGFLLKKVGLCNTPILYWE